MAADQPAGPLPMMMTLSATRLLSTRGHEIPWNGRIIALSAHHSNLPDGSLRKATSNHAHDLNRLAAFESTGFGVKFRAAFNGNHKWPLGVFLRGDNVADAQANEIGRRDGRIGEVDDHFYKRIAQLPADPLDVLRSSRFLAIANPTIRGEPCGNAFDRIERNAEVHHPARIADRQLEADKHDDFVRRHDLHELRIAFDVVDREIELKHVFPRMFHLFAEQIGDPRDEPKLDFSEWPADNSSGVVAAAQKAIDDRKKEREIDIKD